LRRRLDPSEGVTPKPGHKKHFRQRCRNIPSPRGVGSAPASPARPTVAPDFRHKHRTIARGCFSYSSPIFDRPKENISSPREVVTPGGIKGAWEVVTESCPLFFSPVNAPFGRCQGVGGRLSEGPDQPKLSGDNFPWGYPEIVVQSQKLCKQYCYHFLITPLP